MGIVRHGFEIDQVGSTGADEVWATGSYITGEPQSGHTISLLHYAAGIWQVYPLTSIVATP